MATDVQNDRFNSNGQRNSSYNNPHQTLNKSMDISAAAEAYD